MHLLLNLTQTQSSALWIMLILMTAWWLLLVRWSIEEPLVFPAPLGAEAGRSLDTEHAADPIRYRDPAAARALEAALAGDDGDAPHIHLDAHSQLEPMAGAVTARVLESGGAFTETSPRFPVLRNSLVAAVPAGELEFWQRLGRYHSASGRAYIRTWLEEGEPAPVPMADEGWAVVHIHAVRGRVEGPDLVRGLNILLVLTLLPLLMLGVPALRARARVQNNPGLQGVAAFLEDLGSALGGVAAHHGAMQTHLVILAILPTVWPGDDASALYAVETLLPVAMWAFLMLTMAPAVYRKVPYGYDPFDRPIAFTLGSVVSSFALLFQVSPFGRI